MLLWEICRPLVSVGSPQREHRSSGSEVVEKRHFSRGSSSSSAPLNVPKMTFKTHISQSVLECSKAHLQQSGILKNFLGEYPRTNCFPERVDGGGNGQGLNWGEGKGKTQGRVGKVVHQINIYHYTSVRQFYGGSVVYVLSLAWSCQFYGGSVVYVLSLVWSCQFYGGSVVYVLSLVWSWRRTNGWVSGSRLWNVLHCSRAVSVTTTLHSPGGSTLEVTLMFIISFIK